MPDRDFYDRERERNRDFDRGDRASDRERERTWDRDRDRWNERQAVGRQDFGWDDRRNRREEGPGGGEWGRESRYDNQGWNRPGREQDWRESERWNRDREPQYGRESAWGNREDDRWRDRSSYSGQSFMGRSENYPRGSSGSEGGYGRESSYGSPRDLSTRGGGTGLRDSENWSVRSRERDLRNDYSFGGGMGGGMSSAGYTRHWGGDVRVGASGGAGTYSQEREGGRFSGRGPKNWRRSDDRIREDVNERLTAHPDVDASEIDVHVRECEVTLSGTVDDRHAKRIAEDIAENVSGVKDVHNNIRVQRSGWFGGGERDRDRERQGLGSGFDTTTGNPPTSPLGLNQQAGQQQRGQSQQQQNQYAGQHQGAGQTRR